MSRLWVVEVKCIDAKGESYWEICDIGLVKYVSTDFYEAHRIKREQQRYLQARGSSYWIKNKFRVVEYVRKRED